MDKHIDQGITGGKEVSDLPGGSVVNPWADMVAQPNKSGGEQGSGDGIDNIISNLQQQAEKRGACISGSSSSSKARDNRPYWLARRSKSAYSLSRQQFR